METQLKDSKGKKILLGDFLETKWGGWGEVMMHEGTLSIGFESGNYIESLDDEMIREREMFIAKRVKA